MLVLAMEFSRIRGGAQEALPENGTEMPTSSAATPGRNEFLRPMWSVREPINQ
jgi:hypothetical protein